MTRPVPFAVFLALLVPSFAACSGTPDDPRRDCGRLHECIADAESVSELMSSMAALTPPGDGPTHVGEPPSTAPVASMATAPVASMAPPPEHSSADAPLSQGQEFADVSDPICVGGDACESCTLEQCCEQMVGCEEDLSCVLLFDCVFDCTTDGCVGACVADYPEGLEPLDALLTCVETSTASVCSERCGGMDAQ